MTRENSCRDLRRLADTLVDAYDIIDFMQTLAERCVELLDVAAAGIMLADPDGNLRHARCSSEQMRLVELFELQVEEGPCFDAYRDQVAVICDSLEMPQRALAAVRAARARERLRVVSAVPMRLRSDVIGALNLFSSARDVLTTTTSVRAGDGRHRDHRHPAGTRDPRPRAFSAQLEVALESRIVIEQAKGIVAEHNRVDVDGVFDLIRRFARVPQPAA